MAARTLRIRHQEEVIQKIQASQLINRLQNHAFGEVEMTSTQVDSAKFLLNKLISNAPTQTEIGGIDGSDVPLSIGISFVEPTSTISEEA
jgi:hypothetical protein